MKEIVVISGKGGTGKTSITASFASLASGKCVLADCDVDAADLHLICKPKIKQRNQFRSGHRAVIRSKNCTGCGKCLKVCRFDAINEEVTSDKHLGAKYFVDTVACEGCGVCVRFCPSNAIDFVENICGEFFVSETRFGPMVHAKLGIASENSGKLVTIVRDEAKKLSIEKNLDYIIIDGPCGIGCPVIASLTSSKVAIIVTEPTISGYHDLQRIAQLTKQLCIPAIICVNKWDINPDITEKIRQFAKTSQIMFAGTIRYDKIVTKAQMAQKTIVEYTQSAVSDDIVNLWRSIELFLSDLKSYCCF